MSVAAMRRTAMIAMVGAAVLGTSACGAVADKAAEKATEKVTEEVTGAEDVDISEDGVKVETQDGSMALGSSEVPDGWPDDLLPIPDDAGDLVANTISDGGSQSLSVTFTTSGDFDDAVERYTDALEDAGWEEIATMSSTDYASLSYSADDSADETATVLVYGEGDGVQITLSHMTIETP